MHPSASCSSRCANGCRLPPALCVTLLGSNSQFAHLSRASLLAQLCPDCAECIRPLVSLSTCAKRLLFCSSWASPLPLGKKRSPAKFEPTALPRSAPPRLPKSSGSSRRRTAAISAGRPSGSRSGVFPRAGPRRARVRRSIPPSTAAAVRRRRGRETLPPAASCITAPLPRPTTASPPDVPAADARPARRLGEVRAVRDQGPKRPGARAPGIRPRFAGRIRSSLPWQAIWISSLRSFRPSAPG